MSDTSTEEPTEAEVAPSGDVDVATLSDRHRKGEVPALVLVGYWVRLGESKEVPDEHQGHIAAIIESPWSSVPYSAAEETVHGYVLDKDKKFLVKTRDSVGAILEVSQDAFAEVAPDRAGLLQHA